MQVKLKASVPSARVEPEEETPTTTSPLTVARVVWSGRIRVGLSRNWMRNVHAVVAAVLSLNLLLILVTGFLIQHRDALKLDERTISRKYLPGNYRSQDGPGGVRADIVVTDLHSGRMFGPRGALLIDAVTVGWLVMLMTGLVLFLAGRWRKDNGFVRNGNGEGKS